MLLVVKDFDQHPPERELFTLLVQTMCSSHDRFVFHRISEVSPLLPVAVSKVEYSCASCRVQSRLAAGLLCRHTWDPS